MVTSSFLFVFAFVCWFDGNSEMGNGGDSLEHALHIFGKHAQTQTHPFAPTVT